MDAINIYSLILVTMSLTANVASLKNNKDAGLLLITILLMAPVWGRAIGLF